MANPKPGDWDMRTRRYFRWPLLGEVMRCLGDGPGDAGDGEAQPVVWEREVWVNERTIHAALAADAAAPAVVLQLHAQAPAQVWAVTLAVLMLALDEVPAAVPPRLRFASTRHDQLWLRLLRHLHDVDNHRVTGCHVAQLVGITQWNRCQRYAAAPAEGGRPAAAPPECGSLLRGGGGGGGGAPPPPILPGPEDNPGELTKIRNLEQLCRGVPPINQVALRAAALLLAFVWLRQDLPTRSVDEALQHLERGEEPFDNVGGALPNEVDMRGDPLVTAAIHLESDEIPRLHTIFTSGGNTFSDAAAFQNAHEAMKDWLRFYDASLWNRALRTQMLSLRFRAWLASLRPLARRVMPFDAANNDDPAEDGLTTVDKDIAALANLDAAAMPDDKRYRARAHLVLKIRRLNNLSLDECEENMNDPLSMIRGALGPTVHLANDREMQAAWSILMVFETRIDDLHQTLTDAIFDRDRATLIAEWRDNVWQDMAAQRFAAWLAIGGVVREYASMPP